MILIADSGSTKTQWTQIDSCGSITTCTTQGMNPFFLSENEIIHILSEELKLPKTNVETVYFYGAGCTSEKRPWIQAILTSIFQTTQIHVYSDLEAAARSLCGRQAGIACILGTGSNSCYYDGKQILNQVPSLGYILGDEGSGADLGKHLLSDILKNQLPESIRNAFFQQYEMRQENIIESVYQKPYPNRFLAQFTPFIIQYISEPSITRMVEHCFSRFIQRNLLQYTNYKEIPVHFTGGVAFHLKETLETVCRSFQLRLGQVTEYPMLGLIDYHTNKSILPLN